MPAVAAFVAFALADDPARGQYDALPRGDHGDLRLRLLVLTVELVVAWLLVVAGEAVLAPVRASRRQRLGHAESGAADAARAVGGS